MAIWATFIISGICVCVSFAAAFFAFRTGDGGAAIFAGFGALFGVSFVITGIKIATGRNAFFKRLDKIASGKPQTVSFAPHWFMMTAMFISGILILAAILIPILSR